MLFLRILLLRILLLRVLLLRILPHQGSSIHNSGSQKHNASAVQKVSTHPYACPSCGSGTPHHSRDKTHSAAHHTSSTGRHSNTSPSHRPVSVTPPPHQSQQRWCNFSTPQQVHSLHSLHPTTATAATTAPLVCQLNCSVQMVPHSLLHIRQPHPPPPCSHRCCQHIHTHLEP
jgi:hypothetical protein